MSSKGRRGLQHRCLQQGDGARRHRHRRLRPQPEYGFRRQPHPPKPRTQPALPADHLHGARALLDISPPGRAHRRSPAGHPARSAPGRPNTRTGPSRSGTPPARHARELSSPATPAHAIAQPRAQWTALPTPQPRRTRSAGARKAPTNAETAALHEARAAQPPAHQGAMPSHQSAPRCARAPRPS